MWKVQIGCNPTPRNNLCYWSDIYSTRFFLSLNEKNLKLLYNEISYYVIPY